MVDISTLINEDAKTGIQRVVRNILREWLKNPPAGYRVEPVYATMEQSFSYAKSAIARISNSDGFNHEDVRIEYGPGDIFLGLDLSHHTVQRHKKFLQGMHLAGVDVRFVIYDLVPLEFPEFYPSEAKIDVVHSEWLSVVSNFDGAVCISNSVAYKFTDWMKSNAPERLKNFQIDWFHLGADMDRQNSNAEEGFSSKEAANALLNGRLNFLMVGTIEPRKCHGQVLDAFEELWRSKYEINLVIAGKQGWLADSIAKRLKKSPELNKRLFWLSDTGDKELKKLYAGSTCLIAASAGEGFGLPLIEAAHYNLPIIARDIPIFREVAGEHAYYFNSENPSDLAKEIANWLNLYHSEQHPKSDRMTWLTWEESANKLAQIIV